MFPLPVRHQTQIKKLPPTSTLEAGIECLPGVFRGRDAQHLPQLCAHPLGKAREILKDVSCASSAGDEVKSEAEAGLLAQLQRQRSLVESSAAAAAADEARVCEAAGAGKADCTSGDTASAISPVHCALHLRPVFAPSVAHASCRRCQQL